MRICILSKHLPPRVTDGIARNRWLYARMFQRAGWEVHIITSGIAGVEEYVDGIYIHEIAADETDIKERVLNKVVDDEDVKHMLAYSYAVYKRVKKLIQLAPIDIIDSSLWGLEGLITKIKIPHIPVLTRVDTTTRLIYEINYPDRDNDFTTQNQLEQFLLSNSDSLVFNSWSILQETERLYEISLQGKPYAVVHHGVEIIQHSEPTISSGEFKIVVPGRLEKRKGTHILINSVLPKLLANEKDVEVHFVGKDNSDWDGFKTENGLSYTEMIKNKFSKDFGKRLFIHGYVSDEELDEYYSSADCILAPSLYESMGLVYLEAANHEKPLIALRAGAVTEIFENNKEALLISVDEPQKILDAIRKLKTDVAFRRTLSKNAKIKLSERFNAESMASRSISFIEECLDVREFGTVYQLMNSLNVGDGVSAFTRDYDNIFKTNGQHSQIMGNYCSDSLSHLSRQIHEFNYGVNDTILYHYCGCCEWAEYANSINVPAKIFFFHNITPPHFFKDGTSEYASVVYGLRQVPSLGNFDLYVALSQYSLNILQQLIPHKLNTFIIPQLVDKESIISRTYSQELVEKLRASSPFHIIFVGRIVPHKKQTDIVKFAHYYKQHYNNDFHISIIGGGMESYTNEVRSLIKKYDLSKEVTITGKVSDQDLYAYYRSADVYLSMSEHEGFGIPLAEAMVFEVPVVAYGVTAIPETVGDNGCIFYEKEFSLISGIVSRLQKDETFKNSVLLRQNEQLNKYSKENVWKGLKELQDKCHELHTERLNRMMNEQKLYHEEFINFKDTRIRKNGEWRVADGRTLINYGNDPNNSLDINIEFTEADVYIINSGSSGKAAIYLNNKEVLVADLYSALWTVKKYTIANLNSTGLQNIKIVPLGNRNHKSSNNEVIFYGINVKSRQFDSAVGMVYKDSMKVNALP